MLPNLSRRFVIPGIMRIVTLVVLLGLVTGNGAVKSQAHSLEHQHHELDIEEQLKRFNKPALKTIESEDGEIIDCVEIYKQPALHHPLLKDHKIQMRPSFMPKMGASAASESLPAINQTWHSNGACPSGTIPIRRVRRSDLLRAASLEDYGIRDSGYGGVEMAGVVMTTGLLRAGAKAGINVWAPAVEQNEWSHSNIEMTDDVNNHVEAGYLVNPSLFGDTAARMYTYWTADGYHNTGCYNLLCSGFIQISKKYALGAKIWPVSIYNGQQYYFDTVIFRDNVTPHWWFMFQGEIMGYWPAQIFGPPGFEAATTIKWAGAVVNTKKDGHHTTTQMGSGHFANEKEGKAAYYQDVRVLYDDADSFTPLFLGDFSILETQNGCYSVKTKFAINPHIRFYYGGPGGDGCDH